MANLINIEGYGELLVPIDVQGPSSFVYAYAPSVPPGDLAMTFLTELKDKERARYAAYLTGFRMVGARGYARDDKWHMLDRDMPPKGVARDARGIAYGISDLGEFKNIGHKSRIFHLRDGKLFVLLTAYRSKKENSLTADALNPAIHLREQFFAERQALMTGRTGGRR